MDGTLTDTMRVIPVLLGEEFNVPIRGILFRKFQNFLAPYYYENHNWMNSKLPFHLASIFNRSLFSVLRSFGRMGVRYSKSLTEIRLFPGTFEALESVRALGLKIGLSTNGRLIEVNRKLPEEILRMFEVIITKEWGIPKKPKPDLIILAARRLGVPLRKMIYVGDTLADMMAAKAAGCQFILVGTGTFGTHTVLIDGFPAKHVVRDIRQVPSLLGKMLKE